MGFEPWKLTVPSNSKRAKGKRRKNPRRRKKLQKRKESKEHNMAGPDIDLSSFTDLMTCILGVLVLIILLTGIDASQISVLVATPKEITGDDKSPVFFECRNQQLFYISTDDLKDAVDAKTEEIRVAVAGDPKEFLKQAAQTMLEVNGQKVDYTMALVGKYELIPIPDAEGYSFDKTVVADEENWYAPSSPP